MDNEFQQTDCVNDLPRGIRLGVSQQTIDNVKVAFQRSPQE